MATLREGARVRVEDCQEVVCLTGSLQVSHAEGEQTLYGGDKLTLPRKGGASLRGLRHARYFTQEPQSGDLSRKELLALAKAKGIKGRTRMSNDELRSQL